MQKISNFDVEIDVIPNGLEKYMAFTINNFFFFFFYWQHAIYEF